MELGMSARQLGENTVVTVTGEVDLTSVGTLRDGLDEQLRSGHRRLVVDLGGVTFLDSTGLGVLVALSRTLRGGGAARLVCNNPRILRLFSITSLDEVLVVHDTVDAALADLGEVSTAGR